MSIPRLFLGVAYLIIYLSFKFQILNSNSIVAEAWKALQLLRLPEVGILGFRLELEATQLLSPRSKKLVFSTRTTSIGYESSEA